jgi:hypothetical protein
VLEPALPAEAQPHKRSTKISNASDSSPKVDFSNPDAKFRVNKLPPTRAKASEQREEAVGKLFE